MEITEVRIKLMEDSDDRLQAFCSITFDDCFVIRDLKIIEGSSGPFVAMPSRKLTSHCPQCGAKNHLRAAYCNQCGLRLKDDRQIRDQEGRAKLYADIAHPINSECREMIQNRVISEYQSELERAKEPGYVSRYDEDYCDDDVIPFESSRSSAQSHPESERHRRESPATSTSKAQIEPAQTGPRGPHRAAQHGAAQHGAAQHGAAQQGAAQQGAAQHTPAEESTRPAAQQSNDDFGAGVFD